MKALPVAVFGCQGPLWPHTCDTRSYRNHPNCLVTEILVIASILY
jgi:hypothetical protein